MQSFSVLISVYKNENPSFFVQAIESILSQTLLPEEIVLIRDGVVSDELQAEIDYFVSNDKLFTYIPLDKNSGLGNALNIGVERARNELIARMDTDDICIKNRFEMQIKYMSEHPEVDVLGGQILEFIGNETKIVGKRSVPTSNIDIKKYIKKRSPFNHVTVVFRKNAVLKAGNYQDIHFIEDYYLWCRMHLNECFFANLSEVLVLVRIDLNTYRRRGGYKYYCSWKKLEIFKYKNDIINIAVFLSLLTMRFVLQVVMPNQLRGWIIQHFSRDMIRYI